VDLGVNTIVSEDHTACIFSLEIEAAHIAVYVHGHTDVSRTEFFL
jgi:hypothetical protein